jgi:hypothetical protein
VGFDTSCPLSLDFEDLASRSLVGSYNNWSLSLDFEDLASRSLVGSHTNWSSSLDSKTRAICWVLGLLQN